MSDLFSALPGVDASVSAVSKSLNQMWADTAAAGKSAPPADEVKATQLNLVLHFGFATTAEDGIEQFQTALQFARRYPCRVVVLCPLGDTSTIKEFRAKVYGECFFGKSKGDTRCIEFVILSYPATTRQFLESQVSVCLSTDLPLYYWAHRFSQSSRLSEYHYLLSRSKRVIFDTAIVPEDALSYPWPRRDAVRDLAYARLLHVRQLVGQFLSGTAPGVLVEKLKSVSLSHASDFHAEALALGQWLRERLMSCGMAEGVTFKTAPSADNGTDSLSVTFNFTDSKRFTWRGDFQSHQASFEANFGGGNVQLRSTVRLLAPEAALSEAMFF